jgi:TRAP-type mannitol/chloroaromatic compound transport system permease large subunit
VVGAAVTTLGMLAMPEMLRGLYSPELAMGTICAAGTLGCVTRSWLHRTARR